ncbi:hypothetical protein ASPVEDRAFT_190002 [Aspergillus versicolor CBS 583.65]|uniref:Cytochrome P450 n=1 Tax=Aspergillus versicolor CBS 583.65 TaxID=1036611 RepID=A0A1L9PGZ2_ASPVE|nr:uncharacterized protein ASPVEDRAFT_190002 [Aspergillus versicolor CBS 583.65]OJJ00726.1 hypothetical protein ASPVEDRAFT_190002 [Aspergillus versicolor CBS 583.65]
MFPASLGLALSFAAVLLGLVYSFRNPQAYPLVNGKRRFEFRAVHAQGRFLSNARGLIQRGLAQWPVFRILTDNGYKLVLSPKYANEIRSREDLNFVKAAVDRFHAEIPGFEVFKQATRADDILQDAIRTKMTQSLGNVTKPLSQEMAAALQTNWTDSPEWHTITLKPTILNIIAQISSRVFLGGYLCRNPDWLRITVDYTVDSFTAADALRLWPALLRPIVAPFIPSCRKIRAQIQEARDIILPVLEQRKKDKQAAIDRGDIPEEYNDAMEWMERSAKGRPYDAAIAQLTFSVAAIHTTSDMLVQVLYDICAYDGLTEELRAEVTAVLKPDGCTKTALHKLKLMDSVMKESQRLKPSQISMIKLADGTVIPKNTLLYVSSERMWDESIYPDPDKFDPYRFLRLRNTPGHEASAQLITPTPEHLGFGLGKHACPGRFFAANEMKVALCYILLKYDIKMAAGWESPPPTRREVVLLADPRGEMVIRRREAGIEVDA